MKKTITLLMIAFVIKSYSQSINLQLDTAQVLNDSDGSSIAYADIDLDGDNDLLITGNGSLITSTLYVNNGSGNFTAVSQPAIVNVFGGAAEFADVDNDGDMDLVITGITGSPMATANLYMNDGTGNFTLASGTPFLAMKSGDIDFGDIDGDNDLDLIITGQDNSGNSSSKLYINNGLGSFTLVSGTIFTSVFLSSTEFIDIDNDGDLDLLVCGRDNSNLPNTSLYTNNGSGTFSLVTGTPFDNIEGDIAFGDTDNDGDQDILLVGKNDSNQTIAKLYINNGTSFSLLPNTPFPGTQLHSSSFADFNNDGKLDLLDLGVSSNGLIGHIYENQGSNNFILTDSTTISGSYNGSNIVADLNGDNKMDVVTTGTSFTAPFRAPKIYFNQSVIVSLADLNNEDNNLVLYPNPSNGNIHLELNSTSQTNLEIYDVTGKIVLSESFSESNWQFFLNEKPGLYLLRLNNNNRIYTRKIQLK